MKRIIFSHESDIDGLGSIVLSKIAFKNFDYELFPNINELEKKFREYINNNYFDTYDEIFITDLSLYYPSIDMVNEDKELRKKVKVFDHHQRAIDDGIINYDFVTLKERDESGKKCCGTGIYYDYLLENGLLDRNDTLDEFCELIRLEDTWTWKENGKKGVQAHDLAILLSKLGIEKYIDNMVNKIRNNDISFTKEDIDNINSKKDEYAKLVDSYISKTIYLTDEDNNKFGIVYAPYEYRNEITDKIINDGNKNDIDYMVVVALDKGEFGQKSYRRVKDGFDVNKVAKRHGGGGHPGAAGVYLNKEQKEKALLLNEKEALIYLSESCYKKNDE